MIITSIRSILVVAAASVCASLAGCAAQLADEIQSGDIESVKQAIANGESVTPNTITTAKMPMEFAIESNNLEMVKLIHDEGAQLSPYFLLAAVRYRSLNTYAYIVESGVSPNECFVNRAPLIAAVANGDMASTKLLMELGATPAVRCGKKHYHATLAAAEHGHYEILKFLAGNGAPVNLIDENGNSPLLAAVKDRRIDVVKMLLDAGAYPEYYKKDQPNKRYIQPMSVAAEAGDGIILRLLTNAGANPNIFIADGVTPLMMTALRGHFEASWVLLSAGAYHTYKDVPRQPIEYAIKYEHQDIANLLTKYGAQPPVNAGSALSASDTFSDVGTIAATTAVIWAIAESSGYGGAGAYNVILRDEVMSADANRNIAPTHHPRTGYEPQSQSACNSDFQCSVSQICLKKPGNMDGICVNDAGNSRVSGEHDSIGSAFTRELKDYPEVDCPIGTHWDPMYQACIN